MRNILKVSIPGFTNLPKISVNEELDLNRISLLLRGIVNGNNSVVETPLYDDFILKDWETVFNNSDAYVNERLLNMEMSNKSKFGPRSISKKGTHRVDDVNNYYEQLHAADSWKRKLPIDPEIKGSSSLRPISFRKAIDACQNATNSGLPFYSRKGLVKETVYTNIHDLLDLKSPCLLFTRTQEGNKTRTVWGYPFADTANEMRYFKPFFAKEKEFQWRASIVSPDKTDFEVTRLIDSVLKDETLISVDFSAYDSTIRRPLVELCSQIIQSFFQASFHDEINGIFDRMLTIGLVTPWRIYFGEHGVPSGSTFTNTIDSLAQLSLALDSGVCDTRFCQIQGDDGVYKVKKSNVDALFDSFKRGGLTVNKEKSLISSGYCTYLQCLHDPEYRNSDGIIRAIYPTYRALCRLCYQERFVDFESIGISGQSYYSIRSICILENCKSHPMFEELVRFVAIRDKYLLNFGRNELNKFANDFEKLKGGPGLLHRYGDDVRGIYNFATVKLLNKI